MPAWTTYVPAWTSHAAVWTRRALAPDAGAAARFAVLSCLALAAPCAAQWTVRTVSPTPASTSYAALGVAATPDGNGGTRVQVVGSNTIGFNNVRAWLWNSAPEEWVDLHPAGAIRSTARGTDGTQQVGEVAIQGATRASVWSGSAASWVDLHQPGSLGSSAYGVSGGVQVGTVAAPPNGIATTWNGTADSITDIGFPGGAGGTLSDIAGGQIVGAAYVFSIPRAVVRTAAGWVDLYSAALGPARSFAEGTDGVQQAGYTLNAEFARAVVWSGTAQSAVILHPPGSFSSTARDVAAGFQVGDVQQVQGQSNRAIAWRGTAASRIDLHALLPAGYASSTANGAASDGRVLYVCGSATHAATGQGVAFLWSRPLCAADFDRSGARSVQDLFAFLNAWFTSEPSGDFNNTAGITSQDIFDFITAWFAGCP